MTVTSQASGLVFLVLLLLLLILPLLVFQLSPHSEYCTVSVFQLGYYQCFCAPNYGGRSCTRSCPRTLDVAFVIDMSDGIDSAVDMLNMTIQMIQGLPISATQVHVSLLTYATKPTIQFYLNNYTNVEQVGHASTESEEIDQHLAL